MKGWVLILFTWIVALWGLVPPWEVMQAFFRLTGLWPWVVD